MTLPMALSNTQRTRSRSALPGAWAEQRAWRLLRQRGWRLLSSRWRCRWGELKLPALQCEHVSTPPPWKGRRRRHETWKPRQQLRLAHQACRSPRNLPPAPPPCPCEASPCTIGSKHPAGAPAARCGGTAPPVPAAAAFGGGDAVMSSRGPPFAPDSTPPQTEPANA